LFPEVSNRLNIYIFHIPFLKLLLSRFSADPAALFH